jgi:hypothetical protein
MGGAFFPDGKRIMLDARQPGRPVRSFILNIEDSLLTPFSDEGVVADIFSPDGSVVAAKDADGKILLYPVAGGPPRAAPGPSEPGEINGWSADGKWITLGERRQNGFDLFRRELATGRRELVKRIAPADPAGILFLNPIIAPAGRSYVYSYGRGLATLYMVQGLK